MLMNDDVVSGQSVDWRGSINEQFASRYGVVAWEWQWECPLSSLMWCLYGPFILNAIHCIDQIHLRISTVWWLEQRYSIYAVCPLLSLFDSNANLQLVLIYGLCRRLTLMKHRRTKSFCGRDRIKRPCIDSIMGTGSGAFSIMQNGKWWNGLICCTMSGHDRISIAVTKYRWKCMKARCCTFLRNGSMKWVRGYGNCMSSRHTLTCIAIGLYCTSCSSGSVREDDCCQLVVRYELWCKMEFDAIS